MTSTPRFGIYNWGYCDVILLRCCFPVQTTGFQGPSLLVFSGVSRYACRDLGIGQKCSKLVALAHLTFQVYRSTNVSWCQDPRPLVNTRSDLYVYIYMYSTCLIMFVHVRDFSVRGIHVNVSIHAQMLGPAERVNVSTCAYITPGQPGICVCVSARVVSCTEYL